MLFAAALVVVPALWAANSNEKPTPHRAEITGQATELPPVTTTSDQPVEEPLVIEESGILSLQIPSVAIDIKVSGATMPRESPSCHGASVCIDPPVATEAAWYGAFSRPAVPSTNSVLIFGHSNWSHTDRQVFNNLPAVMAGDAISVTTETGVFVYSADTPTLEEYTEIPMSENVYGQVPDKLVLVTCNDKASAATVVTAHLVHAMPR
jgi:hypothetical protein